MTKFTNKLPLIAVLLMTPLMAATVTFDTGLVDNGAISNGYEGLNWDNFYALNTAVYGIPGSGYNQGVVSPDFVAYNAYGSPAEFSSGSTFTLTSLYLNAAWSDGLMVDIRGYNGATELFMTTVEVDTPSPATFVNLNWAGVDRVRFESYGGIDAGLGGNGEHFALDNLTINGVAAVPEPASLALMGAALAGLALLRRR